MRNHRLLLALLRPVLGLALVLLLEPRSPLITDPGGGPPDVPRVSTPMTTGHSDPGNAPADMARVATSDRPLRTRAIPSLPNTPGALHPGRMREAEAVRSQVSKATLHATTTLRIQPWKVAEDRALREMKERDF